MAGFLQGFQQGFSPAFNRGMDVAMRRDQFDQEMALKKAADARIAERHDMDMSRLRGEAARQSQYDADVDVALKAQNLGMVDKQATAAAQATAGLQAVDMNSPSGMYDAAPAAPVARGLKASRGQTSRALAEAGLQAGKIDIPQYNAAGDQARGYDVQDIMGNLAAQYAKDPQGVWGSRAVKYNPQDSGIPIIAEDVNPATGKARLSYTDKNGKGRIIDLTPAQQLKLIQAEELMNQGFGAEAQKMMAEVDANMADIIMKGNKVVADVFAANKDADYKDGALANDRARTGILASRARAEAGKDAKNEELMKLAAEAEGVAQGYRRAQGLGAQGVPASKIYGEMYDGMRVRAAGLGGRLPDLAVKPDFDPVKYAGVMKDLSAAGVPQDQVRIEADRLFGRAPDDGAVIENLKKLNEGKGQPKPGAAAAAKPPVDRIGNSPIGPLTPRSYIEQAAAAGNPNARRALDQLSQNDIDIILQRQGLGQFGY